MPLQNCQTTTTAALEINLPANNEFGSTAETFTLRTYDTNFAERNISFDFSPTQTENQWRINVRADNLTSSTLGPGTTATTSTTATTATPATERKRKQEKRKRKRGSDQRAPT